MDRFRQFGRNAGFIGVVQTIAILVLMGLSIGGIPSSAVRIILAGIFIGGLLIGFAVRNLLVDRPSVTGFWMNLIAFSLIGLSILYRNGLIPAFNYAPLIFIALTGSYLGCYFWFLSDSRVEIIR